MARDDNDFIYWKDAKKELVSLIDSAALEIMMVPAFSEKRPDGVMATLGEISAHNSLIAIYNDGIRTMAQWLKDALNPDEKGADPDE